MARKKADNGLLFLAIVAIVAIVGLILFFETNLNNTTGTADAVDAAILDVIGEQNIAGHPISTACRDTVHRLCDSAANQKTCVAGVACLL